MWKSKGTEVVPWGRPILILFNLKDMNLFSLSEYGHLKKHEKQIVAMELDV